MSILDPSKPSHARVAGRLRREIPIWLTTVNPAGQPQSSPVWFLWDDGVFHVLSKPDATKIVNLRRNPLVSLHLQADEAADEDVVIFEGTAAIEDDGPEERWLAPYMEKYRELLDSYGSAADQMQSEYSVRIRVVPTRIRTS